MRDKILLGKRRGNEERQTKSGVCEIAGAGSDLSGGVTDVAWDNIDWLYAVRTGHRLRRRNVVVESPRLVVSENQRGVSPTGARHETIDQACDVVSSRLHINRSRSVLIVPMFIPPTDRGGLDWRDLGQSSILQVGRKLRDWHQILRQGRAVEDGWCVSELIDVRKVVEARGGIGSGTICAQRSDIDFPRDARILQFFENSGYAEWSLRWGQGMRMAGRSCS